ncbi:MAG TPA: hypothetical protein VJJ53_00210 [Candidatus Nanoarchaeia archaeon]|nr:hypothetical protein [Candidatus Nanoarchaeia archaeon]
MAKAQSKIIYASGNSKRLSELAGLAQDDYSTLFYIFKDYMGLAFENKEEEERFNNAKKFLRGEYLEDELGNFGDFLSNSADSSKKEVQKTSKWFMENKLVIEERYAQNLDLLKKELTKYDLTFLVLLEDDKKLVGDKDERDNPDAQVTIYNTLAGEMIKKYNPSVLGILGFINLEYLDNLAKEENNILMLGGNPPQNEPDVKEKLDLLVDRSKLVLKVGDSNSKYPPKQPIGPRTELFAGIYSIDDALGGEKIEVAHSIEINHDGTLSTKALALQKDKEDNLTKLVNLEDYLKEKESKMQVPFVLEEDKVEQMAGEVENLTKKEQPLETSSLLFAKITSDLKGLSRVIAHWLEKDSEPTEYTKKSLIESQDLTTINSNIKAFQIRMNK